MPCLLGVDLGTSSVKALVIRDTGETVGLATEEYSVAIPFPGYAEQDPEMWSAMAERAIRRAVFESGVHADKIGAVSFSGQMHGLVCVDATGSPLRPAIIWQDQRTRECVRELTQKLGSETIGKWIQNSLSTGFLAASLYWLKRNEPDVYAQTYRVLLPKDYLKFTLSGKLVTDYSDAAGTGAFDNIAMRWSDELLEALHLDRDKFPPIAPSTELLGTVTPEAAKRSGLSPKTVVVNGGSDHCMQALGNGILGDGIFSSNIGTGGQLSVGSSRPFYDLRLRTNTFAHAVPDRWTVMGAVLSAGASMRWLARTILGMDDFTMIDAEAGQTPPGSGGILFLPYLAGERTPHLDPAARGVFCGLTLGHSRGNLLRAVMEGVTFALRDSFEIILEMGAGCERIIASGGGANSPLWMQIQADIFEREIVRSLSREQACLGAAITAGVGTGVYACFSEACGRLVRFDPVRYQPEEKSVCVYRELFPMFRELYCSNRAFFPRLGML